MQLTPFKIHNTVFFSIFTGLCNHLHNQSQKIFIILKRKPILMVVTLHLPLIAREQRVHFMSVGFACYGHLVNGSVPVCCDWLVALRTSSRFVPVAYSASFLFVAG